MGRDLVGRLDALRRTAAVRVRAATRQWRYPPGGIVYLGDGAGWVIDWIGHYLLRTAERRFPHRRCLWTTDLTGLRGQLLHCGSLWTFLRAADSRGADNTLVPFIAHGDPDDPDSPTLRDGLRRFRDRADGLPRVVTASSIMERRLLRLGVQRERLVRIPLGVDLDVFRPPSPEERRRQRERVGVPPGHVCIGSFQKDGVGWGAGDEPKRIKGPDILVDAVRRLADRQPVYVVLTGPARGYVMRGLERAGVPYHHAMVKRYHDLVAYYHALDLYLITSREEGGPLAVTETMATGVPLVSTCVGMAPDLVEDGRTGWLVDPEDIDALVDRAARLASDPDGRRAMAEAALARSADLDWRRIGERYCDEVYAPVLEAL